MNNSASDIRTQLLSDLGDVTELKQVVLGHTVELTGFPACRVYLSGIENELLDNAPTQQRKYIYAIQIIQEQTAMAKATAEAAFEDAIDATLDKLHSEWTMSGNAEVAFADSGSINVEENVQGAGVSAIILLEVTTFIDG